MSSITIHKHNLVYSVIKPGKYDDDTPFCEIELDETVSRREVSFYCTVPPGNREKLGCICGQQSEHMTHNQYEFAVQPQRKNETGVFGYISQENPELDIEQVEKDLWVQSCPIIRNAINERNENGR
jgi:hypothetical protein